MKRVSKVLSVVMAFIISISVALPAFAEEVNNIVWATITMLNGSSYTYSGKAIEPNFEVKLGDDKLEKDVDYTVTYKDNVNAGTATATITGINDYTGTVLKKYTIKQASISKMYNDSSLTITCGRMLAGKTPSVIVKQNNGITLRNGIDYIVTVVNKKMGFNTGRITVEGKGNYIGKKVLKVNVYPNEVTGIKMQSRNTAGVTVTWNSQKNHGVTGYTIYYCDAKGQNLEKIGSTSKESYTIKRSDSIVFYYTVRAFYKDDIGNLPSQTHNVKKTCAVPAKVKINSVTKGSNKKTINISWNRVKGSGYELQYGIKSDMSNAKTITISDSRNVKKAITVSDNTKEHFVRIRAFRNFDGKKVYGEWSDKVGSSYQNLYASYSSNYVNNADRTTNLRIASGAINDTVLRPGDVFSFNGVVGQRTAAKGYKKAHVFTGATSMTMGVGGGVCQVASTMFNAALLANLPIVERHQHSQRVAYVPLGRDAAIYWGSEDFKFKNNTKYNIKIKMTVKDGKISCYLYTCENVKPAKVSLSVSRNGNRFTLYRKVGGKTNYSTSSVY